MVGKSQISKVNYIFCFLESYYAHWKANYLTHEWRSINLIHCYIAAAAALFRSVLLYLLPLRSSAAFADWVHEAATLNETPCHR